MKSRIIAGILAILLGGFGAHEFYIGKIQNGLLCIAFCWSLVPSILGIVEGIKYLCCKDDQQFHDKYCV